jgi:hypothetical protein
VTTLNKAPTVASRAMESALKYETYEEYLDS